MLIPSTITARRTRRYTSTWYIHPTTHKHDFEPMDGRGRYIFQPPQCRRPAKASSLTGQQKCHIHPMENVTLTQKEQTRLQVLNSFLTEHIALDQAAELMGVSPRHTRRILAAYQ